MTESTQQNLPWPKLTPAFVETFVSKESLAGDHLAGKLDRELDLLMQARHLIVRACAHVDEVSQTLEPSAREMACAMLSVRLINDARSIAVLVGHGYVQQAIAVATAMSDAAFTLAALASDDTLALEWINHEELRQSVISTKKAIRRGCERVRYLKNVDVQVKFFWDAYQFLSAIKHGNPRLLKRLDLQDMNAEMLTISVGPSASVAAHAVGSLALLFCQQILLLAARAHLEGFPSNPQLSEDIEFCRRAGMDEIDRLRDLNKPRSRAGQTADATPAGRYDTNGVREP